ncbi:MAG: hypothetical protein MJ078_04175 [Clostridia bacterium]|nr:hypothetical protein [Clostridia bacterium]
MGFGYCFLGLLLTFNVAYGGYTDIFAFLLMALGLLTLSKYEKGFENALRFSIPVLLISGARFVLSVLGLLGLFAASREASTALTVFSHLFKMPFFFTFFTGVYQVAKETDIPVLMQKGLRNRLFVLLYGALAVVMETDVFRNFSAFLWVMSLTYLIMGLLVTFLNAKTVYECYIWICLPGDENMERKTSRFGFINKLNALSDKIDADTLARKEEEKKRKAEKKRKK